MARIFLIEIDPNFADCLRNILETEGFEVGCSDSVRDAMESIQEFQPALTIVDMHDGGSINAGDITNLANVPQPPRILVTANYKTPEIAFKALGAGADDYLLKPFSTREIIERVHTMAGDADGNRHVIPDNIDEISNSIRRMSSPGDILTIALDQIGKSLNLADCLISVRKDNSYKIVASHGYSPNPVSKMIDLASGEVEQLRLNYDDPFSVSTGLANKITQQLGIQGHRPFPTLMPLGVSSDDRHAADIMGFVLGHGAIVVDETDILEMEQFLARISSEILDVQDVCEDLKPIPIFDHDGELLVPKITRDEAVNKILSVVEDYLNHERDAFWIRLVLDEAINNAILHGHKETLDKPVTNLTIKYFAGPEKLVLVIEDSGDGFNLLDILDPTADENLLSINGRGIFLMRNIMDTVAYNEKGNIVTMVKDLDKKPFGPNSPGVFDTLIL